MSERFRFMVWCPDLEDEDAARGSELDYADDAATEWADRYVCEGGYTIFGGFEKEVLVRDIRDGPLRRFIVKGEAVPTYHAFEMD